jgi:hypothetical protein
LGCDEHSLTLWIVAELEPQLLVEAAETRWFGLCQYCTDIAERIDHRVNLGIAKSIRDRRVLQLGLCCGALCLGFVDPLDQCRRINAYFDGRLQSPQPHLGLGKPCLDPFPRVGGSAEATLGCG